ncbi:MAG: PilZ domain-containing protein [Lachnospiraceae bacterium]|nr:PilZ domain-containing protein [Lachnospiraceae bacterium]
MYEKRRYKRLPIQLNLEVSQLFKQDNDIIPDLNAEIHVFDINQAGIGFTTTAHLPEGYYFNATIVLESSEQKILTVVKILNVSELEDGSYRYGCEFVGLAGIFNYVFEDYAKMLDDQEQEQ